MGRIYERSFPGSPSDYAVRPIDAGHTPQGAGDSDRPAQYP